VQDLEGHFEKTVLVGGKPEMGIEAEEDVGRLKSPGFLSVLYGAC
jgi:hypothetical protein